LKTSGGERYGKRAKHPISNGHHQMTLNRVRKKNENGPTNGKEEVIGGGKRRGVCRKILASSGRDVRNSELRGGPETVHQLCADGLTKGSAWYLKARSN